MKSIRKNLNKLLLSFLLVILMILLLILWLKKGEFEVAQDVYRQYYWPKISEQLEKTQDTLTSETITISVTNLKMMDKVYERKLRHRRGGTLIIKIKQPYEQQKIDFKYVN